MWHTWWLAFVNWLGDGAEWWGRLKAWSVQDPAPIAAYVVGAMAAGLAWLLLLGVSKLPLFRNREPGKQLRLFVRDDAGNDRLVRVTKEFLKNNGLTADKQVVVTYFDPTDGGNQSVVAMLKQRRGSNGANGFGAGDVEITSRIVVDLDIAIDEGAPTTTATILVRHRRPYSPVRLWDASFGHSSYDTRLAYWLFVASIIAGILT